MTISSPSLLTINALIGMCGWILFYIEFRRSRDYVTDLSQLIHDYDLERDDLRRSLGHREIEKRLERKDDA